MANDGGDDNTARVTGTVMIPAELEGFAGKNLELRLYKIHPLLADASADLVDIVVFQDIAHAQGKVTQKTFEIGKDKKLEVDKKYYITCFILDGTTRTHIGEPPDKGLCKVLTHGCPREVTFTVRPVR